MRRRRLLQLGAGAAALLATAGGVAVLVRAPLTDSGLSAEARLVFSRTGEAVLDQSLPSGPARDRALAGLVQRIEALVGNLPHHARQELSQLLAVLCTAPGRRVLAGLRPDWPQATLAEVQAALQDMRLSASSLRRQAYQALHEIAGAAYFAEPSTWTVLGYPGPREIG